MFTLLCVAYDHLCVHQHTVVAAALLLLFKKQTSTIHLMWGKASLGTPTVMVSSPAGQICLQNPSVADERSCCTVPYIWLHTCQGMPAVAAQRLLAQLLLLLPALLMLLRGAMCLPRLLSHAMLLQLCITQTQCSQALPQVVAPPMALYDSCMVVCIMYCVLHVYNEPLA